MTEVMTDYFFEAIDEFTFPREDSSSHLDAMTGNKQNRPMHKIGSDIFSILYNALEDTMVPSYESHDSLMSRTASQASINSTYSASELKFDSLLNALQSCFIQQTNSTLDFPMIASKDRMAQSLVPNGVQKFVAVFDEFMHNPGNDDE